jgi:hypothetical protein
MSERKPPDDRELDDFLAGRSEVSRRYREGKSREVAPPELDQPVLERARQALESRRTPRRRLALPLSLAATVVLAFSVVVSMREEPQRTATSILRDEIKAPAETAPAAASSGAAAPVVEERALRAAKAKAESRREAESRQEPERKKELAPPQPMAAEPTPPSAPSQRMSAPVGSVSAQFKAADEADVSPQSWLERIRKLQTDGNSDGARRELEAFRRTYPDYAIPDDLKALAQPSP